MVESGRTVVFSDRIARVAAMGPSGECVTPSRLDIMQTMNRIIQSTLLVALGLLATTLPLSAQGFGRSVAVDGEQILVLKPGASRGPAAVLVYERGPDGWTEVQRLGADVTTATGEGLGPGLVAKGGLAMIAGADPDASTAAHVFERQPDGRWTAVEPIPMEPGAAPAGGEPQLDMDGLMSILVPPSRTLSTDGERVLVGSVQMQGSGLARLLERDDETGEWRVASELTPTSGDRSGGYGNAVLLTPDRAFVGAPRQDGGAGVVYVYEAAADGWTETARIDGEVVGEARRIGSALGLRNDVLLVGAPGTGDDAGQVILLRRNADGSWEAIERLEAPAAEEEQARNGFGASIEASSDHVYVGAPGAGAVYDFAYEMSPNPGGSDLRRLSEIDVGPSLGADIATGKLYVIAGAPSADGGVGRVVVWEDRAGSADVRTATVLEPAGALETIVGDEVRCTDGEAAGFPCRDVDLLSFLTVESLGGAPGERVSDIWGWTDPETGVEYALVGRSGGLVIVDLGRPASPAVVATIAANASGARDIKTYADHAFFTGDGAGQHGLVVFDLTRLRDIEPAASPAALEPDTVYEGIASAHNLAIDPESGFAYVVRPSQGGETCGGGLHIVDVRTPTEPTFAGCFTDTAGVISPGSSHDAQCVVYDGPDEEYRGRQICFASNESLLRIVDVTDKENPVPISSASYPAQAYVHQGWLTEDHAWFFLDRTDADPGVGSPGSRRSGLRGRATGSRRRDGPQPVHQGRPDVSGQLPGGAARRRYFRAGGTGGDRALRHDAVRRKSAGLQRCVDGLPVLRERRGRRVEHERRPLRLAARPSPYTLRCRSRGRAGRGSASYPTVSITRPAAAADREVPA